MHKHMYRYIYIYIYIHMCHRPGSEVRAVSSSKGVTRHRMQMEGRSFFGVPFLRRMAAENEKRPATQGALGRPTPARRGEPHWCQAVRALPVSPKPCLLEAPAINPRWKVTRRPVQRSHATGLFGKGLARQRVETRNLASGRMLFSSTRSPEWSPPSAKDAEVMLYSVWINYRYHVGVYWGIWHSSYVRNMGPWCWQLFRQHTVGSCSCT